MAPHHSMLHTSASGSGSSSTLFSSRTIRYIPIILLPAVLLPVLLSHFQALPSQVPVRRAALPSPSPPPAPLAAVTTELGRLLRQHTVKLAIPGGGAALSPTHQGASSSSSTTNITSTATNSSSGAAQRRVVIITASTHHYAKYARNLRCAVRDTLAHAGGDVLLFALDEEMLRIARAEGMPVFDATATARKSSLPAKEGPHGFGSNAFNVISKLKLLAVRDALTMSDGADVLFTDVDVVWCADAASEILRYSAMTADRLLQQQKSSISGTPVRKTKVTAAATAEDAEKVDVWIQNGREEADFWPMEPNTGFFLVRGGRRGAVELFDYLVSVGDERRFRGMSDQHVFMRSVCAEKVDGSVRGRAVRGAAGQGGYTCLWDERVRIHMLPLETFPNGNNPLGIRFHRLPAGRLRKACVGKEIAVFHNNWCNSTQKTVRMNEHKLWSLDSSGTKCVRLE